MRVLRSESAMDFLTDAERQIFIELKDAARRYSRSHDRRKPTPADLVFEALSHAMTASEAAQKADYTGFRTIQLLSTRPSSTFTAEAVTRAETVRSHFENLVSGRDKKRRRQVLILSSLGNSSRKVAAQCGIAHTTAIEIKDGCLLQIAYGLDHLIELLAVRKICRSRLARSTNKIKPKQSCELRPLV